MKRIRRLVSLLPLVASLGAFGCGKGAADDPGRSQPTAKGWYAPAVGSGARTVKLLWRALPGVRAVRISQRDLGTARVLTIYATTPSVVYLAPRMRCVSVRLLGRPDARPLRSGVRPPPFVRGEKGPGEMEKAVLRSSRRKLNSGRMRCNRVRTVKARGMGP